MISIERLEELLSAGESLELEYKSDRRQISDKEIYEEIVAFANTSGGVLLIGVENDGSVSGTRPRHGTVTDPIKLQSAVFNNTVPNINTRVSIVPHENGPVLAIEIDSYPEPCATATGKSLRRIIGADGKPQTVPFYPRDQRSRRSDLGLIDFSAHTLETVSFESLDPLEFERLRQTVGSLRGDKNLLNLSNEDIAKALRLVESHDSKLIPNIAGLLLLGREEVLQKILPTHEVHFQVIDDQGNVKVNDAFRWPLLRVLHEVESRFAVRNEEQEVTVGLFRLPIPDYSKEGFREAFNNALIHRDYNRLDAVYVQWQPDHLLITNPGGFPEGITINNILVHEPKPRNPRLAEAFKRIGLIEQTGRGVDKIYMGQLRYGRPAPDYTRSDSSGVRVVLRGGKPSLQFAAYVYEQDKQGNPLTLDELMVLNALFFERRIDSEQAGKLIQKGSAEGRAVLEKLHERGLIEGKGEKKGRVYHMSAELYRRFGSIAGYVRAKGFDKIQQCQMVLSALKAGSEDRITREAVAELCKITKAQAYHLLKKMCIDGELEPHGKGRGAYYTLKRTEKQEPVK